MAKVFHFFIYTITIFLLHYEPIAAQTVICNLKRVSDTVYSGACKLHDSLFFTIQLKEADPKAAFNFFGQGARKNRNENQPLFLKLNGDSGKLATTFLVDSWYQAHDYKPSKDEISFTFDLSRRSPPDESDLAILRRTAEYLSDSIKWDKNDMRINGRGDCPLNSEKLTLFCALNRASVDVLGGFYAGPSFLTLLESIQRLGNGAQHPMQDFNNDPKTTFAQLRAVLDDAILTMSRVIKDRK